MDNKVIEYSIIGAYLVFIVAKGIKQSGKIKDKEDFLIAGRNTGWFMLFCTVSATIVGGGYSIGAIGKTFENGLLWVIVSIGGYMQLVFSGKYIAPIFRKHNLYTIAAYFRKRFDHRSGFIAFLLSMLFSVGVLGAQLIAFGEIINHMIPEIPYNIAVVIGASVVILYSTIGGLFAVIHTDMYQFIILSIGFFITAVLCIPEILSSGAPPIPSD